MPLDAQELFSFPLDEFQLQAAEAIAAGQNVVVTAPTGSGKTVVAEYAVYRALEQGLRCFYTTPLKALSNQKFHDFCRSLGEDRVGLLTGDVSVRRDAPVIVMTTEVYRNMLYGTTLGDVGRNLAGVETVILDECHYMNDAERGTVWEESIIYTPASIQLVGLSATIANARELADWIGTIHRDTELIETDHRPVPLRFFYFHRSSLYKLLAKDGRRINPRLLRLAPPKRPGRRRGGRPQRREEKVAMAEVVAQLSKQDMLPAIFFVFSRRGCEKAMREARGSLRLPREHRRELNREIDRAIEANESLGRHPHLSLLREGLSVHHAGVLPAWKALVEHLFGLGLIPVVFATETLAAGINMPARTTVISAISKYSGDGHRPLTGSEFLQMSGRAGRRGMDPVGNVVILYHPKEDVHHAAMLARAKAEPLESNFRPSYGMVLNLLERRTLEQSKELIEKSFGQFLAELSNLAQNEEEAELSRRADRLAEPLCPSELGDQRHYRRMRERYQTALKQTRALAKARGQDQLEEERQRLKQRRESLRQEFETSPCHKCPEFGPCREQEEEKRQVARELRRLRRHRERATTPYWEQFQRLVGVLQERQYLNGETPTEMGLMAASFRATNVLFLAELVASGVIEELQPAQVAGLVTALVSESGRRQGHLFRPPVSRKLQWAVRRLELLAEELEELQDRHQVDVSLDHNAFFSGMTEMWAGGADWLAIEDLTGLEPGDILRTLRRTLDVCRQFAHSRGVPAQVSELSAEAEHSIARDEVWDSLNFLSRPEEAEAETT